MSQAVGAIESVARSQLQELYASHALKSIDLRPPAWMLVPEEQIPEETKAKWLWRRDACTYMLDPDKLNETVGAYGDKAALIRLTIDNALCSRPEAYKLWAVLVRHGFSVLSLMPRFAFCGGPGVARPVNEGRKKAGPKKQGYASPEDVPHPQRGLGARQTGLDLSLSYEFAPPRRPDWKGVVEVLHRISKDQQFTFLPGAFDARRKELELRQSRRNESALNLREYAQFLYGRFEHYNLFADRSSRMSAEMIAADIEPTPAGLWRFGHEAGFGYQRAVSEDLLVKHLLRQGAATVRRDGIFFESQEYATTSLDALQEWTRLARRSGVIDLPVYFHPYSLGKIRWVDPTDGMCTLTMRGNARATPDLTLYDWRDALMADRRKNDDRAYARLQAALSLAAAQRQMVEAAIQRTADAEASTPMASRPNVREARAIELMGISDLPDASSLAPSSPIEGAGDEYLTLIDEVFNEMNRSRDV